MDQKALIHAKPLLKKHGVISSHKNFWNSTRFDRIQTMGYPYCSRRWNDHVLSIGTSPGNTHHRLTDSEGIDLLTYSLNHT